jgi:hypothetical protein
VLFTPESSQVELIAPPHTQTEGRAPVLGSEFTTKVLMSVLRGLGDYD